MRRNEAHNLILRDQIDAKIDTVHASLIAKIDTVNTSLIAKIDTMHTSLIARIDARRAETNTSFGEIREDIAAMREDIASIKRMQKATLWLLTTALPLFAVGTTIAKALHWI
jgi:hypothetical protein